MKNKILIIFISLLVISPYLRVSSNQQLCSADGYTIATINGIFTNEKGARENKDNLKKLLIPTYNSQPLFVDYLYNPTHLAGVGDLVDAVGQGLFEQQSTYDLTEILTDASAKVKTQKLLLVAHSQGNFYANSFYDKVASREGGVPSQSIGVYGVGSPASRVAGEGRYLTSDTDNIIASIVATFVKILPPNIHIPLQPSDGNGHSFSDVYLKYQGDRIVSDIKYSLDKLTENNKQKPNSPCIFPPKLDVAHKVVKTFYKVADPTAGAVKTGIVGAYRGGVYIADGAQDAGSFIGGVIRKSVLAVNNIFKKLPANVIEGVEDAGNITAILPDLLDNTKTGGDIAEASNVEEEKKPEDKKTQEQTQTQTQEQTQEQTEEQKKEVVADEPVIDEIVYTAPSTSNYYSGGSSSGGGGSASTPAPEAEPLPKEEIPSPPIPDPIPEPDPIPDPDTTAPSTIVEDTPVDIIVPPPPPLVTFTIDKDTTLSAGEYNYDNLAIINNAVLTLESDPLSLNSFKGVKINAVNITIDTGSSISVDAKGYAKGPGTPSDSEDFAGASYGGLGYRNTQALTYGSAKEPIDLGSGGKAPHAIGGGAIRLVVSDLLTNNGTISASGNASSSGGSILVKAKNISGSGIFSANGGSIYSSSGIIGPGGGGRIALYYETLSFTGKTEALGGCGSYDGFSKTCAKDGTVGFFDTVNNNLLVDTVWQFRKVDEPFSFNDIYISNGAKVISDNDVSITAQNIFLNKNSSFILATNQILNIPKITIDGGSILTLSGSETIIANTLNITGNSMVTVLPEKILSLTTIPNITIDAGSSIFADAKGYAKGPGTPSDSEDFAGASYGGLGYRNTQALTYGSEKEPVDFGSGGINNYRGGGAIRLIVTGILTNNGIISAGGDVTSSGGSVYVTAKNISGSGIFSANGGSIYSSSGIIGPGGGGRIALYYETLSFTGKTEALGGCGSYDGFSKTCAKDGTIILIDESIILIDESIILIDESVVVSDPIPDPVVDTTAPTITIDTLI